MKSINLFKVFRELVRVKVFFGEIVHKITYIQKISKPPYPIDKCKHIHVPKESRVLVDENFYLNLSHEELVRFTLLTGVDQVLYAKAPFLSKIFKKVFYGLPVPVMYAGYGCVNVVTPDEILQQRLGSKYWGAIAGSLVEGANECSMSSDHAEFFASVDKIIKNIRRKSTLKNKRMKFKKPKPTSKSILKKKKTLVKK